MKRWNGWGKTEFNYEITGTAKKYLTQWIGKGEKPNDITLEEMSLKVPATRLNAHPLISTDVEDRIKHSKGQSLADWIAIRSGENIIFPDGVAYPLNDSDVRELINYAKANDAVLIPYGGGSSVVGHINVISSERPVITVDMGRMNKLISLDKKGSIARFQAGVRGPELEAGLRAHGFTLGHFPQSFEFSTLGGWIATRSSGQLSLNYGRIEKLFAGGNVETPVGRIELPPFPASAAGPDLREVIMGSEGRYGIITDATIRISPIPEEERFNAAFFKNEEDGINAVREIAQAGINLAMLRLSLVKETTTNLSQLDPSFSINALNTYLSLRGAKDDKVMLIYGAVGSKSKVRFALKQALEIIKNNSGIYVGSAIGKHWYKGRFTVPYMRNTLWEMGYAVDTLETANIWSSVPGTVSKIEKAIEEALTDINERVHVFSHLSHIYPHGSSIYTTYLYRISDNPTETLERWKKIKTAASQAIVEAGGTISHQHGVGIDHKPFLQAEKGQIGMELIGIIGDSLDANQILNPNKLYR